MFPIRPNEDRVIVRPVLNPEKSSGGLHIPDNARGTPTKAIVMAVGPGRACPHCGLPKPIQIEEGWLVMYPEAAGHEFSWEGKDYKTIRASDITQWDPAHNMDVTNESLYSKPK